MFSSSIFLMVSICCRAKLKRAIDNKNNKMFVQIGERSGISKKRIKNKIIDNGDITNRKIKPNMPLEKIYISRSFIFPLDKLVVFKKCIFFGLLSDPNIARAQRPSRKNSSGAHKPCAVPLPEFIFRVFSVFRGKELRF